MPPGVDTSEIRKIDETIKDIKTAIYVLKKYEYTPFEKSYIPISEWSRISNIRKLGVTLADIAEDYGVSSQKISSILRKYNKLL